jgi:epsilon-lactone hydrolase
MTLKNSPTSLHVPARDIPVPVSVSREAQAALARGPMVGNEYPALNDIEAWRSRRAESDAYLTPMLLARTATMDCKVDELKVQRVRVYVVTPNDLSADDRRVYLDIHGGALYMGGGENCRAMAVMTSTRIRARVWSVDYRMPPDHCYPAALDDCIATYRALLKETSPKNIIVGGGSAGGNLAAALVLRARDEGLPLPAATALLTPELDLTESGDSFQTNMGIDTVITRSLMPINLLYAAGHDLSHPYLSPLFGDFTKGFPPTLVMTGTRDLFLSNAVRMHRALRAADVEAELHVIEAAPHGGFGGAPEELAFLRDEMRFLNRHWSS